MTNTKVKQAEEAVVQARQALTERRKELAEAQKTKQAATHAFNTGGKITATEKLTADLEVDRLERGVRADEQRLTHAVRRVRALSPVLAEKVAHALGDSIFEAQAQAQVALSRPTASTKDVTVTVIETRTNEPADTYSGNVKGSVEIVVTGPSYLRPFDPYEVARRLGAGGMNLGFGTKLYTVREDAPGVFSCTYYIESTMPLMPTIPAVTELSVRNVLDNGHVKMLSGAHYSSLSSEEMFVGRAGTKRVGETIEGDVRTVEIEAAMSVRPVRPGVTHAHAGSVAEAGLRRMFAPARGFSGVGVVESAEFKTGTTAFLGADGRDIPGMMVTVRAKLISKVSA